MTTTSASLRRERRVRHRGRASASRRPRRPPAPARRDLRRAASPPPHAGAPPRRPRRPCGRTSGCRGSAPRRAARASRPRSTSTDFPASGPASPSSTRQRAKISSGSVIRPAPTSPSASSPSSGPISSTPRARRRSAFSCVAGCSHMRTFIAGAASTGPRKASTACVRTLSASPFASFASVFAVSGASTSRSASTRWG